MNAKPYRVTLRRDDRCEVSALPSLVASYDQMLEYPSATNEVSALKRGKLEEATFLYSFAHTLAAQNVTQYAHAFRQEGVTAKCTMLCYTTRLCPSY